MIVACAKEIKDFPSKPDKREILILIVRHVLIKNNQDKKNVL